MRQRDSRRNKNRRFKLIRQSLSLFIEIAKVGKKLLRFAVKQLLLEISLGITILGLAYVFASWGISQNLALYVAIAVVLGLFIVAALVIDNGYKSKSSMKRKAEGELKLAVRIAHMLSKKASLEWTEYQDWLHDILLARDQLLVSKCPRWKVVMITYWRLSVLLIVVSLTKIKGIVVSVMKLR